MGYVTNSTKNVAGQSLLKSSGVWLMDAMKHLSRSWEWSWRSPGKLHGGLSGLMVWASLNGTGFWQIFENFISTESLPAWTIRGSGSMKWEKNDSGDKGTDVEIGADEIPSRPTWGGCPPIRPRGQSIEPHRIILRAWNLIELALIIVKTSLGPVSPGFFFFFFFLSISPIWKENVYPIWWYCIL